MVAMPDDVPLTTPNAFTDAVPDALLLHAPPAVASESVILLPWHTAEGPLMAAGSGLTFTGSVVVQPDGSV
jgi:hypothetical protein